MDAPPSFRVLDFSGVDEPEPVRVRSVENENDDVSGLFLPFKAGDHPQLELVPDLSAGTAGPAIPAAGPTPTYRGGSILPAEAPRPEVGNSKFVAGGYEVPIEDTAALMAALTSRRVRTCPQGRARASRGRPIRRRGSRRTAGATRAGPEPGDPEPAGFGAPVGDTSRVDALAGRLA